MLGCAALPGARDGGLIARLAAVDHHTHGCGCVSCRCAAGRCPGEGTQRMLTAFSEVA